MVVHYMHYKFRWCAMHGSVADNNIKISYLQKFKQKIFWNVNDTDYDRVCCTIDLNTSLKSFACRKIFMKCFAVLEHERCFFASTSKWLCGLCSTCSHYRSKYRVNNNDISKWWMLTHEPQERKYTIVAYINKCYLTHAPPNERPSHL